MAAGHFTGDKEKKLGSRSEREKRKKLSSRSSRRRRRPCGVFWPGLKSVRSAWRGEVHIGSSEKKEKRENNL